MVISTYICKILMPRLKSLTIREDLMDQVAIDIEYRLRALAFHWTDKKFRRALMATAIEDATFYRPPVDLPKRCFVVLGIRNSMLEDIHTSDPSVLSKYNIEGNEQLTQDSIKGITADAISYFGNVNLPRLSSDVPTAVNDPYEQLPRMYPMAWEALNYAGNITKTCYFYESRPITDFDLSKNEVAASTTEEIKSAMDPDISSDFWQIITDITNGEKEALLVPALKHISRMPNKLFKVIELILQGGGRIVTCNMHISNGYVRRRSHFIRPEYKTAAAYMAQMLNAVTTHNVF